MVARLKLKGIDGKTPPGVEFAAFVVDLGRNCYNKSCSKSMVTKC